jgi:hypothetical protein
MAVFFANGVFHATFLAYVLEGHMDWDWFVLLTGAGMYHSPSSPPSLRFLHLQLSMSGVLVAIEMWSSTLFTQETKNSFLWKLLSLVAVQV